MTLLNSNKHEIYQIKSLIGQGGMANVFLAEDTRLHRTVAIKKLKKVQDIDNKDIQIKHSLHEARMLAKINHINIVQIFDIYVEEDQISLVMEYIKGKTLGQFKKQHVTSLIQKLELICQISSGLATAHEQGVVHCDIKDSNIIIDENGNAKITDFGIALLKSTDHISKIKHAENSENKPDKKLKNTYVSSISASPEQLQNQVLDFKSDLFSLGLLAFSFITGRHPFESRNSQTITQAIINEKPINANTISPKIPQPLAELLNQLLEKNKSNRPHCSQQVAQSFKQILIRLSQEEISAQDTLLLSELNLIKNHKSKIAKNNNKLTKIAGIFTFLIVSILFIININIESEQRYVVVLKPELINNSKLSEAQKNLVTVTIDDSIRQMIINNPKLKLISRKETAEINAGLKKIASATGATDIISTDLSCNNNRCNVILSHLDGQELKVKAQRNWVLNIKNYREIYHNSASQLSLLLNIDEYFNNEQPEISEDDYIDYIELYNKIELEGQDNDENIEKLKRLLMRSPQLSTAYSLYRKTSLEMFYQTKENSYLNDLSYILSNAPSPYKDTMLFTIDRTMQALAENKLIKADRIIERSKNNGDDPVIYHELKAGWYLAKNQLSMAIKQTELALDIRPNIILQYNLAALHFQNANIEQSKAILLKLMRLLPNHYKPNQLLADIHLTEGDIDAAITAYNRAIIINAQPLDLNNLALSYLLKGQYNKALVSARKAWSKSPNNSMMLLNLADIELLSGNRIQAKKYYQKILRMLSNQETFYSLIDKAQAYVHLKEHKKALRSLNQAIKLAPNRIEYSYAAAIIYTLSGEKKSALIQVEEAVKAGYGAIWFNLTWFNDLCDQPEFNKLLLSLGSRNHCLD